MSSALSERLYTLATDDDGDLSCEELPAGDREEVPRNFMLNASNGAATKLAEQLASPDVVLPTLLGVLGAPIALVGFLEPVRRGGAMAPQLLISGRMRQVPVRKWFWVGAGLTQALALGAMALAAGLLSGSTAGWAIVVGLVVFSIASGVGSVAFSDVLGKTIPQGRRGQLLGLRATVGGLFTIAAGVSVAALAGASGVGPFLVLLVVAAALWALASLLFAAIGESAGSTEEGRTPIAELRAGLAALRESQALRRFMAARLLLVSVELAIPFVTLAAVPAARSDGRFGLFIVAIGVANLLGGRIWGRVGDRSSRALLGLSGALGVLAAVAAIVLGDPGIGIGVYPYSLVLFLAGLAQAGVRLARKTWVVDNAPPKDRPLWTALANTLAGAATLAFIALGPLAQVSSVGVALGLIAALGAAGTAAAVAIPETA